MTRKIPLTRLIGSAALFAAGATQAAATAVHEHAAGHTAAWIVAIDHEARMQRQAAAALAHHRLTPRALAPVDEKAAAAERMWATALLATPDAPSSGQFTAQARALGASLWHAEHGSRAAPGERMDSLHARVTALREAEQQSWLAHRARSGHLTATQVAAIERGQARILDDQAALERRGHETVDEALRIQHAQDVQDWSIRTAHLPGDLQA